MRGVMSAIRCSAMQSITFHARLRHALLRELKWPRAFLVIVSGRTAKMEGTVVLASILPRWPSVNSAIQRLFRESAMTW